MTGLAIASPRRYVDPRTGIIDWLDGAAAMTSSVRDIVLAQLVDPVLPATELASSTGSTVDAVLHAYGVIRRDPEVARLVSSLFYARRLQWTSAAATVTDWLTEPRRPAALQAGQPVQARTVELHATKGTCGFQCGMCLWSDQEELTYATRGLRADGLLSTSEWCQLLDELVAGGTTRVVLSGGGEVLLNRDLPLLLAHARDLGLGVHLYTTGFNMPPERIDLWSELARLERIRFSIHSPRPATYNAITGLPAQRRALDRVRDNIARLLEQPCRTLRVGVGFVAQPLNVSEIVEMADFAAELGVDFLDIRKDEVDVTTALDDSQLNSLTDQLREARDVAVAGGFGPMWLDLADELVALANRERISRPRTPECLAKYFRPTVSPFGILAPCDLTAEPRFADSGLDLGNVGRSSVTDLVAALASHHVPDACAQCMPSSRTGNAVHHKLLADLRAGIALADQPFVFDRPRDSDA